MALSPQFAMAPSGSQPPCPAPTPASEPPVPLPHWCLVKQIAPLPTSRLVVALEMLKEKELHVCTINKNMCD